MGSTGRTADGPSVRTTSYAASSTSASSDALITGGDTRPGGSAEATSQYSLIPSSRRLRAAFTSRSCATPHSAHVHSRTDTSSDGPFAWQAEHRRVDGKNRSTITSVRLYHAHL